MTNGILYTNPKGRQVREFSHSQASQYRESPAKYKHQRIGGWYERLKWASAQHGIALQAAVEAFLGRHVDPVEIFGALWAEKKDVELRYSERQSWESLDAAGQGLMRTLVRTYKDFPVADAVFFNYQQRQKVRDQVTGIEYTAIPDMLTPEMLIDIKTMERGVSGDTSGAVVNDPQLRTQAAVVGIYRVALWVFVRNPYTAPFTLDEIRTRASGFNGLEAQALAWLYKQAVGVTWEEVGRELQIDGAAVQKEVGNVRRRDKDTAARLDVMLEDLRASRVPEYRIEFHAGEMSKAWAEDALRDDLSLVPLIQQAWFPCRCGIRWPNDQLERCPYRGLCLKEATPNATPEQIAAWDKITVENLITAEEAALAEL